jgi:very-short-patch-repair endonuclease
MEILMPNLKHSKNNGKFVKHAKRVDKKCQYCGKTFQVKVSDLKYGRGKCCSRKCVDLNKKRTYKGNKNPMFGTQHSNDRKQQISEQTKELWKTDEYRINVRKGIDKFVEENGYWPGTDNLSKYKREQTLLKRYGKKHSWEGEYGTRKGDLTTIKKYGRPAHLIRFDTMADYAHKTHIEKIVENILVENNIDYVYNKCICRKNYDCRYYDFYIPQLNLLIECDGDYWHGNPKHFTELNETQLKNVKNDKYKDELAKEKGFRLIRFWEEDIIKQNFNKNFLDTISEKI